MKTYAVIQIILSFAFPLTVFAATMQLPETGQTSCWDGAGNLLASCNGTGQDGAIKSGAAWPEMRFADNGDGTVADNLTGLIWLKDAGCLGSLPWQDALDNVRTVASGDCSLADGSVAGDWRLPSVRELYTLINVEWGNPSVWLMRTSDPQWFSSIHSGAHWSSSTNVSKPSHAWIVDTSNGAVTSPRKGSSHFVTPVRNRQTTSPIVVLPKTGQSCCWDSAGNMLASCVGTGQDGDIQAGIAWPSYRFTDNDDGSITDNLTGLIWLKDVNCLETVGGIARSSGTLDWPDALTWSNALASGYCGLADGSASGDWRVPNILELHSVINAQQASNIAWLTGFGFRNILNVNYWSSSTVAAEASRAWAVALTSGKIEDAVALKFDVNGVWPVRGGRTSMLTVIKGGSGRGNVGTNIGTLIWSGVTGVSSYPEDAAVALTASPDAGSTFAGWSGGGCTGIGDCQATLGANTTLVATFFEICAIPTSLSAPASNTTGGYQVSWSASSTPGVTYHLLEGTEEIYVGSRRYVNLVGRTNGIYNYSVLATKDGYADSAVQGPVSTTVVLTCGDIPAITAPTTNTTGNYQVSWSASSTPGVTYHLFEGTAEIYAGQNRIINRAGKINGTYSYTVMATKDGYVDSSLQGPASTTVILTCGDIPGIYAPVSNTTGSYQVSWNASDTPGVTYRLFERTAEIYAGPNRIVYLSGKASGTYDYTVMATKGGYVDSAIRGPVSTTVAR